ncbi:MAG: methyltransferase domain-containing protein [Acidobacteriaceae bacterium]
MPTNVHSNRWSQIVACAVASLFILGIFFPLVGTWTGAILGVWFVGTQKPSRGFLWMCAFTFLPSLATNWRKFPLTGPEHALEYVAWLLFVALLTVLPFLFHRLVSPRLPGLLSTLPLPLSGAVLRTLALAWLPANIFRLYSLAQSQKVNTPLLHIAATFGIGAVTFLIYWFAAVLLWMWNDEFRASKIAVGASLFATVCVLATGFGLFRQFTGAVLPPAAPTGVALAWICLGGALALSIWALLHPGKPHLPWANRPEIALLQSPYTQTPLQVVREDGRETLVSPSGERFPIRDGIPIFLKPEDLTGSNRKYNHLYETIGGFYDDTQRVVCALRGVDQDAHFLSYLPLLEIKPGDSVLETSVGTGLNFKYLPRGIQLFGLDLSPEMLANCETNLRRWQLDADMFLGNAESLPFADSSFDVVFHVGGINFFSDRARAIHEMIRVAKPGSLILIADETEEHVKDTYEHMPIASAYFKGRKEAVAAPIDLVPPQMQDIRLQLLLNDRFYALTFRKPAPGE